MGPRPEEAAEHEAHIAAGNLPLNSPVVETNAYEVERYSAPFAAVLAENAMRAPVPAKDTIASPPRRRGLSPDDSQHLPALMAAALACLLLTGTGAASWYAIIGALPRDELAARTVPATEPHGWVVAPATLVEDGTQVPNELRRVIAASQAGEGWSIEQVWLPAAEDPVLSEPVTAGIETTAAPPSQPPSATAQPVLTTAAMAAGQSTPANALSAPGETAATEARGPGPDTSATTGSGDKDPPGYSFIDPYPEKPATGLPGITTASQPGGGGAAGNDRVPAGGSVISGSSSTSGSSSDGVSPGGTVNADHSKRSQKSSSGGHQGSDWAGNTHDSKDNKGNSDGKGPSGGDQHAKDSKAKDHADKDKQKDKDKGGDKGHGGHDNGKGGD